MTRMAPEQGFSVVELVIAMAIILAVAAGGFDLLDRARRQFDSEPAVVDRQQRVRVAVDALVRDLTTAGALFPYRLLGASADPAGTFRNDVLTVIVERPEPEDDAVRTYYLRSDTDGNPAQLMRAEGGGPDAPVADQITALRFDYLAEPVGDPSELEACVPAAAGAAPLIALVATEAGDGPWCSAAGIGLFDADLLRVRSVLVSLRVAGTAGDVRLAVSPRNLNQRR
jgi:prepilin-type N-terminal cleavage/methylation domain-containing protein